MVSFLKFGPFYPFGDIVDFSLNKSKFENREP